MRWQPGTRAPWRCGSPVPTLTKLCSGSYNGSRRDKPQLPGVPGTTGASLPPPPTVAPHGSTATAGARPWNRSTPVWTAASSSSCTSSGGCPGCARAWVWRSRRVRCALGARSGCARCTARFLPLSPGAGSGPTPADRRSSLPSVPVRSRGAEPASAKAGAGSCASPAPAHFALARRPDARSSGPLRGRLRPVAPPCAPGLTVLRPPDSPENTTAHMPPRWSGWRSSPCCATWSSGQPGAGELGRRAGNGRPGLTASRRW